MSQIALAKPYHYRRQGVYYLRIRPVGSESKGSCTISLRSTDRTIAMTSSYQLRSTLRAFHLDNPDATWEELRAALKFIAEDILATPTEWEELDGMGMVYSDMKDDLRRIASTAALTVPQAKAVSVGIKVCHAAEKRLMGDPGPLVDILQEMEQEESVAEQVAVVQSQAAPVSTSRMTFKELYEAYLAEHEVNVKPSTANDIRFVCEVMSRILGDLDMKTHTRSDLLALREKLLEDKMPSTVNKMLSRLSTVLSWGVNVGHIDRSFDKRLKILKGAESSREAFSQEQVAALMAHANGLPASSWERWALSLGAITGARIGEIQQLRRKDVKLVGEYWVIDVNEEEGRSLKTKHSVRLVPLVDGAYGFNLQEFLGWVDGTQEDTGELFREVNKKKFCFLLNEALRDTLKLSAGENLSFHSLRHSMAGLLKAHGVQLEIAQAILGHSSQSITFDHYGGGQNVGVKKLGDALRSALLSEGD